MSRVAVIIVSWNGLEHLGCCLPALYEQTFSDLSVILVDNGSTDATISFVEENWPKVKLIKRHKNEGFAFPSNLGITQAFSDENVKFVVTLNNDTIVDPDYVKKLVESAERNPSAASIQPKVINFIEKDVIDSTGILVARDMSAINRGLKVRDLGQYDQEEEIFGASASAALYRREALEKVALRGKEGSHDFFDSDYFAYYEDVDLAWRLRLAGYSSVYTPDAKVYHAHSATGKSYSPFKAFHIHRNQYFNIIKNLSAFQMVRALMLMPRLYLASLMSVMKGQGAASELAGSSKGAKSNPLAIVFRGWIDVLRMLPKMIAKRRQVQAMRAVGCKEIERWFRDYKADFSKIISG